MNTAKIEITDEQVREIILAKMDEKKSFRVWETTAFLPAVGGSRGAYPRSEGYLYRKVLNALHKLADDDLVDYYTTTMNNTVWWLKSWTTWKNDIPF